MTLGGWTGARLLFVWSAAIGADDLATSRLPLEAAASAAPFDAARWLASPRDRDAPLAWPQAAARHVAAAARTVPATGGNGHEDEALRPGLALALAALVRYGTARARGPFAADEGMMTPPLRPTPLSRGPSRLAGSAWAIVRGGEGGATLLGGAPGGQLGGSQAGARLTYALGERRRLALSARVATPLHGAGREAAFGLDWQPTRAPLHLVAEQRVSLDAGRGGPVLMAIGGIGPTPVAAGFRLEAYGEAGAIDRDRVEGFGDGAVRVTRTVATLGLLRLDLGGGAWGAVQRGARRLDVGPTLGGVVPVAGKAVRMTLDWRQRIGGDARPGSGPALSIGTDF
jgi:hypothetical protein